LVLAEGTRVELIIISDEKDGKRSGRSAASILAEIAALPTAAAHEQREKPGQLLTQLANLAQRHHDDPP
jgi:hypothetical protein